MGLFPLSTSRLWGACLVLGWLMPGVKSPCKCSQGGRDCPVTSVFSLGSGNLTVVPRLSLKAGLQLGNALRCRALAGAGRKPH